MSPGAAPHGPIGAEEDAFLAAHSRVFLLATRADGSPTGWPMVGLYPGGTLEFSTYGRSRKVADLRRDPTACCVIAPTGEDRALVLRGTCTEVAGQHEPSTGPANAPSDIRVADGVAERARARMKAGKRVVLRFSPTAASWVAGWAAE